MKGVIFTTFNELVEEKFGLETWEELLERVNPPSEGIYTVGETYPDEELFQLVGELSEISKASVEDLVRTFGEYTFEKLASAYPNFISEGMTLKQFLLSVHEVIHVEVKKLYPEAETPDFEYEDPSPNELVMKYVSPRKLCVLGEGLLDGAAKHFGMKIERNQTKCMHQGDSHCRFELKFL